MKNNSKLDLPIIAHHPETMIQRIQAAWWCLTGRVVTIAIWIPWDKYAKRTAV